MDRAYFYQVYFDNLFIFIPLSIVFLLLIFVFVNSCSICKSPIDPAHFYITFTFGTAYSIVFGLGFLGYISFDKYMMIFFMAVSLFLSIFVSSRIRTKFYLIVNTIAIPINSDGKVEFYFALMSFAICATITIYMAGFGFFADTNRFEQNRGIGVFVRVTDCLRLFIIPYVYLSLINEKTASRRVLIFLFLVMFVLFSSVLNGSKFSLLEAIYSIFIASFYKKINFKVSYSKLIVTFGVVLSFALIAYQYNLAKNGLDGKQSEYISGSPFVVEAMFLRVLANADKYFLSLPNDVIDQVVSKSAILSILSPVIGSTRMSSIVGFNMNDYTIGKQILHYWDPGFLISGGPTSHFDLFSYVHFGLFGGIIFTCILGAYLGALVNISNTIGSNSSIFKISFIALLWLRSLPTIIEPPLGIAYVVDIFIIFGCFKFAGVLIKQRG